MHSITVEPLTRALRTSSGLQYDPNHLAVVERIGTGSLVKVCGTYAASDIRQAYIEARGWADTYGATVLTQSSFVPTVVGADVAAAVAARPDCQRMVGSTARRLALVSSGDGGAA